MLFIIYGYFLITILDYAMPRYSSYGTSSYWRTPEPVYPLNKGIFEPQIRPQRRFQCNIVMLNGALFLRTLKKGRLTVCKASLDDINKAIDIMDLKERPWEEIVPEQYHEFLPVLLMTLADRIPWHRLGIYHEALLREGETPTWEAHYSMSRAELVVLMEWLEKTMSKVFICQSLSQFAAPVQVAKKPDVGLRFCIDYLYNNSNTIKNRYPLPLIREI